MPHDQAWPLDVTTGQPMIFAFQIRPPLLEELEGTGGVPLLPAEHCLSVFVAPPEDPSRISRLSIGNPGDVPFAALASRVLLHRYTDKMSTPPEGYGMPVGACRMILGPWEDEVMLLPQAPDRSQLTYSKAAGLPGWGQKAIEVEGCRFALQLSNTAFEMAGPKRYDDLLCGGIGYLFLTECLREGETHGGYFFIQFT